MLFVFKYMLNKYHIWELLHSILISLEWYFLPLMYYLYTTRDIKQFDQFVLLGHNHCY